MIRPLPDKGRLPHALYRAEQVREFDRCAIEDHGIGGEVLMQRAGAAAYGELRARWPNARDITVLCGVGNNGGDGYVIAGLAHADGLEVRVLQLGDAENLRGDAATMASRFRAAGGAVMAFQGLPRRTDVVVDAVLGTGLERPVAGDWAAALTAVNQHLAPVLAVDIPSGLHADTGLELGVAVRAALTVSFIALKQGMFTGAGPDCCGDIRFHGLQVPAVVYSREILAARRVEWQRQSTQLAPRPRDAHKGRFGHVLVVGGTAGFSGAARMTAEAALRCGAGLVSLATVPPLAPMMNLGRPEIMAHGVADETQLERLLEKATVVAVGPGLGQGRWAEELLQRIVATHLPLVMDADALNLLAQRPQRRGNWVLTPHPGEAARLLGCDVAEVQRDRFAAVRRLWDLFGGNVVLKGAGSVMFGDSRKPPAVCSDGNPGMASGGMGDVLTGLVAGFIAQGWDQEEAALMAVCLHAAAADACAAEDGERGMLATDLLPWCRRLLNREVTGC